MKLYKNNKINLIFLFEMLIVIALVFGPFTALRIGRVGMTEISCLLLVVLIWLQNPTFNILHPKYFTFSRFLFIWILLSLFGLVYNILVLNFESGQMSSIIFNLTSNFIVFISCLALELLIYNRPFNISKVLSYVFYIQSVIFLVLFLLSLVTDTIGGFVLNDQNVFQPLSTNLHHGAMSILPLPFIGMEMVTKTKHLWLKLITLLLVGSNFYIGFEMFSGSLLLGVVAGVGSLVVMLIIKSIPDMGAKLKILGIMSAIGAIILTLARNTVFPYLMKVFEEEDGGGARTHLWTHVIAKIIRNPIFGYGPGAHGPPSSQGGFNDAHQSILTVGVQAGVIPMVLYIRLLIRILIQTFNNPYAFATVVSIYAYVFTTDINRRLPMWIFLMLLFYRAVQKDEGVEVETDLD